MVRIHGQQLVEGVLHARPHIVVRNNQERLSVSAREKNLLRGPGIQLVQRVYNVAHVKPRRSLIVRLMKDVVAEELWQWRAISKTYALDGSRRGGAGRGVWVEGEGALQTNPP